LPRSGAPKKYSEEFRNKVLNELEETPTYGLHIGMVQRLLKY